MKIHFHPDSDLGDYAEAVSHYEQIWKEDGSRIVAAFQKISGLGFRETLIHATVFEGISHSHPLSLRHNLSLADKRATLVHELGHRLLYKRVKGLAKSSMDRHKFLFLILGDVLTDLWGEEMLAGTIQRDKALDPEYGQAWDWALGFGAKERQERFKRILGEDLSALA
jgi:hypothetical protein